MEFVGGMLLVETWCAAFIMADRNCQARVRNIKRSAGTFDWKVVVCIATLAKRFYSLDNGCVGEL
jgi:hypothetical protein